MAAGLSSFGGDQVCAAEPLVKDTPNADKLGWRVGFATYTFGGLTLFETLDKIAAVGLRYAELFAWQKPALHAQSVAFLEETAGRDRLTIRSGRFAGVGDYSCSTIGRSPTRGRA